MNHRPPAHTTSRTISSRGFQVSEKWRLDGEKVTSRLYRAHLSYGETSSGVTSGHMYTMLVEG